MGRWWAGAEQVLGWNITGGVGRAVASWWSVWDGTLDVKDRAPLDAACSGQRSAPRYFRALKGAGSSSRWLHLGGVGGAGAERVEQATKRGRHLFTKHEAGI